MEWFYLIGICLMMYSLYRLKTSQPELFTKMFSKAAIEKSTFVFGVLVLMLLGVVGLAVLSVRGI